MIVAAVVFHYRADKSSQMVFEWLKWGGDKKKSTPLAWWLGLCPSSRASLYNVPIVDECIFSPKQEVYSDMGRHGIHMASKNLESKLQSTVGEYICSIASYWLHSKFSKLFTTQINHNCDLICANPLHFSQLIFIGEHTWFKVYREKSWWGIYIMF